METKGAQTAAISAEAEATARRRRSLSTYVVQFRELGLLLFIILLAVGVQLRNPSFLTLANIRDMAANTAILSMLAVGMMLVILTRGIDLSIGAVLALSGMISALTVSAYPDLHPLIPILIGVGVGLACGFIIGVLVGKVGILPIIVTLGMMYVFRGLTFMASGGKWVSAHQMPDSFKGIATGTVLGLNNLVAIAVLVYVIAYYFVEHTRTGRRIYAVGSNPEAAKVSGIHTSRILLLVYTIMGGLSGLSGVLWVSKFASAQGDTATGYELSVIAACVVGGVSIAGGVGKLSGVLLGSILLGMLNNALPLINVSPFWQTAIQGAIILLAVVLNALVKRGVDRNHLMRRNL